MALTADQAAALRAAAEAGLVYAGIRQAIYAALGIAAGFAALQLHLAGQTHLAQYSIYGAAAAAVLLLGSILVTRSK
jgi:hypothetical protein